MASNPLIEALLRRAARGVGQINARGSAIGGALQPFAGQAVGYFNQASGQESALGGALQASQTQTGQQLGGQIGSALQGIQAPQQAVSQYGGGTATTGAQAGAAVGALSSADLQRLQSQGSAEQIYASALPRLAALAADQERRGFLQQMGEELTDRMAELQADEYAAKLEQSRYQAETRYERKQDSLDRRRQQQQDRIERSRYRREFKQKARLEKLAADAARAEYGLDVANTMQDNATSAGNLSERQRHNRQLEAQARAREARQRAKDKKDAKSGGGSSGASYSDIVDSAKDLGKPVENQFGRTVKTVPSKAEARRRLRAEFPGATAEQIARALTAAGY